MSDIIRTGYVDATDLEYHLHEKHDDLTFADPKGVTVFSTVEHLKKANPCCVKDHADDPKRGIYKCGIYKVEIKVIAVIQESDF